MMGARSNDPLFIPPKEYEYEPNTERHPFCSRKSPRYRRHHRELQARGLCSNPPKPKRSISAPSGEK
jgi:hypothetical protein